MEENSQVQPTLLIVTGREKRRAKQKESNTTHTAVLLYDEKLDNARKMQYECQVWFKREETSRVSRPSLTLALSIRSLTFDTDWYY